MWERFFLNSMVVFLALLSSRSIATSLPDSSTVALWRLNEGSGTTLYDASYFGNNGTINNSAWTAGQFGQALHFDGLTSYVVVPNNPSLQLHGEFTVEAWFSVDTLNIPSGVPFGPPYPTLLGNLGTYPDGGGYQFYFSVSPLKIHFHFRNFLGSAFMDGIPITEAHRFYHVAAVYKELGPSVSVKVYLDGVLGDSAMFASPIQYNATPYFYFGTNVNGAALGDVFPREFSGTIDEVRISNIAREPNDFYLNPSQSLSSISVSDGGGNIGSLRFGVEGGATDSLDASLGEAELPPKPPTGNFDARWDIPGSNGALLNIQDTLGPSNDENLYVGTVQPGPAGYPITLRWNTNTLLPGTLILRDAVTHGGLYQVNMNVQDSFRVEQNMAQPFEILYNSKPTVVSNVLGQWNMVSLPVVVDDPKVTQIFPSATSSVFSYNGGYAESDSMENGLGYWLKFGSAQLVTLMGSEIHSDTINVRQGWNMIGSISSPVDTSTIVEIPPDNIISNYFYYSGGYSAAPTLNPMRAYWVKAASDGQLILSTSPSASHAVIAKTTPVPELWNEIEVEDAQGNVQKLFFAAGATVETEKHIAPPPPPAGVFDVRFASDRLVESAMSSKEVAILVSGASYPLSIRWKNTNERIQHHLVIGSTALSMNGEGETVLNDRQVAISVRLGNNQSNALPAAFELKRNYPNPFNPTTMISYGLPVKSYVRLTIVNLVGQVVATLVDGIEEAGYQSTVWKATEASGIYFYKLEATSIDDPSNAFVRVGKMVFLK